MELLGNQSITTNATFILGLSSVGNVGQLATDSILCTLSSIEKLTYIGCLETDYVLPMTGYERLHSKAQTKLCMPIEVYKVSDQDIYIIQQRSLCVRGQQRAFSRALLAWLRSVEFRAAVVLTGASTEDIELAASKRVFHICSVGARESLSASFPSFAGSDLLSSLRIPAPTAPSTIESVFRSPVSSSGESRQHGSEDLDDLMAALTTSTAADAEGCLLPLGMTAARHLLESLAEIDISSERGGAVVALGKFVGEGDNIGDGLELAVIVLNSLGLGALLGSSAVRVNDLVHPESWSRRYGGGITDTNMFY